MGRGRWPSTKIGSFLRVRERTLERFRARLRVLIGRGGMGVSNREANGLYGRQSQIVDSPKIQWTAPVVPVDHGASRGRGKEYVGAESWSQGEIGPRFALSLTKNLCHISQSLWWVGVLRLRRGVPGLSGAAFDAKVKFPISLIVACGTTGKSVNFPLAKIAGVPGTACRRPPAQL